jgi:hypothetical protein
MSQQTPPRRRWARNTGAVAAAVALVVIGHAATRVRAEGVPAENPLVYSGLLEQGEEPVNGARSIGLKLHDAASGDAARCTVAPKETDVKAGRFAVVLHDQCAAAVHEHADLWVEISVDGAVLSPRTKLAAVPYALEARRAVEAAGGLRTEMNTLRAEVDELNARLANGLHLEGPLIHAVERVHGDGPGDETDNGALVSRHLTFTKTRDATGITVRYQDNFRVYGSDACRWEIRFNGASCADPGALAYDYYYGEVGPQNDHRSASNFGTCMGLPAGVYVIQVYTLPTPGYPVTNCYTGWNNQYWALEAEEVY